MRKHLAALCATALALTMTAVSVAPINAAPIATIQAPEGIAATTVQYRGDVEIRREGGNSFRRGDDDRRDFRRGGDDRREVRRDRREFRQDMKQDRREFRREARQDRREYKRLQRRGDWYYYNGHRGYREYRPGYRQVDGWWFPATAFIAGAIITGTIANQNANRGNTHVNWCANRYRSYRAYDNTFQPYNGPRQQCISPY